MRRRLFAEGILFLVCGIALSFYGIVRADRLATAIGSILLFFGAFLAATSIDRRQP